MITTTALTKSYKQMPVVRDVSLRCEPGTITGFLGANGADKDVCGGRVTTEVLAGVARDHQVLLTELRQSDSSGLEPLFFSLTAAKAAPAEEVAA